MKPSVPQYYYLFKSNWKDRFEELVRMVESGKITWFELWVPKDKSRNHHLVITFGKPLTQTYSLVKSVWETSTEVFELYYEATQAHYRIYQADSRLQKEETEDIARYRLRV